MCSLSGAIVSFVNNYWPRETSAIPSCPQTLLKYCPTGIIFSHWRIIAGLRMVEEKPRWRSGHLISRPDVLCKATFITSAFFGWTTARVFCSKFITHCSHWLGSNFLNLNLSEEANCAAQMYPARGTESNSFHIKYFSRSTESSHQSFSIQTRWHLYCWQQFVIWCFSGSFCSNCYSKNNLF